MKILFVASEVHPYSKSGGLADVAQALPAALAELGHEVLVVTPAYGNNRGPAPSPVGKVLTLEFPVGTFEVGLLEHRPAPNHRVIFLAHAGLYGRQGIYGDMYGEFGDNALRFAVLSVGALSATQEVGFVPDIVHLNDWQTGLAALALQRAYASTSLGDARSVFTIHNLAYQGVFPKSQMDALGLPWDAFHLNGLEFHDRLSFMKAGLNWADALTTVSPTYAQEIQHPSRGEGLERLLQHRRHELFGILNGIDGQWDPARDPHLPAPYDAGDLSGKRASRRALLTAFGMDPEDPGPVFVCVSRLAHQKGLDLALEVLPGMLANTHGRFILLGSGESRLEHGYSMLAARFPGKVGLRLGYDEALSHLIEAGGDFFLMPSRYEPCGLNQLYSLRYGTLPIVRHTGGLADTVRDASLPDGTGIVFGEFSAGALADALQRALHVYGHPDWYRAVQERGMRQDFSWNRSAQSYTALYQRLLDD
ncbi:MAG TPA: glycogen synthase GlgA [Myxococcaceae bacterium]|nr:glycogen synthase GlgA [Myxococcaceae bacterium]